MRAWRSVAPPLVAGLLAAAATFAAVASLTRGDDTGRQAAAPRSTDVAAGRAVFAREGCGTCHRLAAANSHGQIAPELDKRLAGHTRASLASKILDPYPDGEAAGFPIMPEDYARRMTAAELDALVSFLLAARRPDSP